MKTDIEEYLGILQEECAEVIVAVSKMNRFEQDGCNPATPGVTNLSQLEMEIGDVEAMVELLKRSSLDISGARIAVAKSKKIDKIKKLYPQFFR